MPSPIPRFAPVIAMTLFLSEIFQSKLESGIVEMGAAGEDECCADIDCAFVDT